MKIGNYEFKLKNFKDLESLSEETYCFSATLYINGEKSANCGNSGHGSPTDIHFFPQFIQLGNEINVFLKSQPKITFEDCNFELDLTLDQKSKGKYFSIKWKNHTVNELLNLQLGCDMLKNTIAREIAKGNLLINENIPPELLP